MQEVKNRPIKELLQLMLDNFDKLDAGLCALIKDLFLEALISKTEANELCAYLFKNKPNTKMHWFPIGEKQPRIEWLQQQIKKQDSFWTKIKNLWS